jgi:uncharacterized repeat protein (TIGR01451 family)
MAVTRLAPLGLEESAERLQLAIGLPLRNEEELNNLIRDLYDSASPKYHQYLTPEEFTARFGPSEEDYQAVIHFAEQNNFRVTATHPNRMIVDVEGSVADIEKAFHVTMRTYQHPKEARIFHAPDSEPSLDLAVPILHISGLDDYSLPHPHLKARPSALDSEATPQSGSGPGGTYRGSDFRAAYSVGALTGAGQNVGLLQFDGFYSNDIVSYASQAGISVPALVKVPIDGGVTNPGSGVGEVSLDIEMVMSMAPSISTIYVYEAPNPSPWVDLLSRMANDNLAKQLSCSWGGGSPDPSSEQIFKQMQTQGQSFFNASGDSDAFTGAIDFPSDSTNITQVGGTTLTTTGAGGSYVSETVWNWGLDQGSYVGSSGGVSTYYAIPSYQQGINMATNHGSTTMRNVPDVALTGDNVYVVYNNGSSGSFGGTSCAAPLWAGFTALMNQQSIAGGHSPLGFLNPAIYSIGKFNANYATLFHDTTNGNNFSASSPTNYSAVPGYDLCTGWGTPNGTNLIDALTTPAPVISTANWTLVAESCFPTNNAIDSGEQVTVSFALKNIGATNTHDLVVTLLATNGVALPSGPQDYGVVTNGGAAVSRSFTFTALGSCGGTITATLQLQDGAVNLGTTLFVLPIGGWAAIFQVGFDGVAAPALPSGWTTSAGGAQSTWTTVNSTRDSVPNSAFSPDPGSSGSNALVSPVILLPSGNPSILSFRNNYNLEAKSGSTTAYDGGLLEIKIGSGSFTDILSAGGTFVTGGYDHTISSAFNNPFKGRQVWSGNSGGFISTVVNLPASASGQNIQLRWRCGADNSVSEPGWYIDSVAISNLTCCTGSSSADLAVSNSVSPTAVNVSSNVTFTVGVTNIGPSSASSVVVTDTLPAGLTFSGASVSQGTWSNNGNTLTAALGTMAGQSKATVTIQAVAATAGQWTNKATVSSSVSDPNSTNNTALASLFINSPPTISSVPNVVTNENFSAGPIGFTIGDAETPAASLVLSASSSNTTLIDAAHITFGGSGASRTITLTPFTNQYGVSTITLGVSDGMATSTTSFTFTVNQVNHPATLNSIPDFTILEESTLMFTNKASDSDQPSQTLTFSLSNAPAGASVDPASGVFTWTPTEAQGPFTNQVTVMVTDNGSPPMTTAQSFTIAVLESNEPPVLAPVVDRTIHAGMTLVITNSATDPDIPTNTLMFSLDPGPAGASIDPASGVFSWSPDDSFANTTNAVTVVVTDNNPWAVNKQQLTDTKSFNVLVVPPPALSSALSSNGEMTLTWSSISGQTYRVQYITDLFSTNWTDLIPDVTATDVTATTTDQATTDAQRFYRVMVLP